MDNTCDVCGEFLNAEGYCDGGCEEFSEGDITSETMKSAKKAPTKMIACPKCGRESPWYRTHCDKCKIFLEDAILRQKMKERPSSTNESLLGTCQNCKHQFSKRASICPKCNQERTTECFVCKKQISQSSKSCSECGDPAPFEQQFTETNKDIGNIQNKEKSISTVSISAVNSHERVQCTTQEKTFQKSTHSNNYNNTNIEFTGTVFGWFWRGLSTIILSCFVIPAPWVLSWFCRWFVGNITKAGDNTLSFTGRGAQIWFPVMMGCILPLAGRFMPLSPAGPTLELLIYLVFYLAISCYFYFIIIRWFFRNILSSTGTKTFFMGEYFPYLGWNILSFISFISIVGWAWVNAGMARWGCNNIRSSNNHTVSFHGKGLDILWRSVTYLLSSILIIPIPWTSLWLVKWYMRNVTIEKQ